MSNIIFTFAHTAFAVQADGTSGTQAVAVTLRNDGLFSIETPEHYGICGNLLHAESLTGLIEGFERIGEQYQRTILAKGAKTQLWVRGGPDIITSALLIAPLIDATAAFYVSRVVALPDEAGEIRLSEIMQDGKVGESFEFTAGRLVDDTPHNLAKLTTISTSLAEASRIIAGLATAEDAQTYLDAIAFFDQPTTDAQVDPGNHDDGQQSLPLDDPQDESTNQQAGVPVDDNDW